MFKQFLVIHIFIFGVLSCLTAQNISEWISANEKNPVEKIYIHTDAENYFTGDTVWFKIYLTDSRSDNSFHEQKMCMLICWMCRVNRPFKWFYFV
jgi:hypothetical protein